MRLLRTLWLFIADNGLPYLLGVLTSLIPIMFKQWLDRKRLKLLGSPWIVSRPSPSQIIVGVDVYNPTNLPINVKYLGYIEGRKRKRAKLSNAGTIASEHDVKLLSTPFAANPHYIRRVWIEPAGGKPKYGSNKRWPLRGEENE